jgi:hypothetical protein
MSEIRALSVDERQLIAKLVDHSSPTDALVAYYGIDHPAERSKVFGWFAGSGALLSIMVVAQTGMDLFRPLFVPFVARHERFSAMIALAMDSHSDGLITMPLEQKAWLEGSVKVASEQVLELYRLDPREFEPILNVLVVESGSAKMLPRYEIKSGEQVQAAAGMNWVGRKFAELYLQFESGVQRRQFPHSVLSAASSFLLDQGRIPLLRLKQDDDRAKEVALESGYRLVGHRSLFAEIHTAA